MNKQMRSSILFMILGISLMIFSAQGFEHTAFWGMVIGSLLLVGSTVTLVKDWK
jgi:hypothetical protein